MEQSQSAELGMTIDMEPWGMVFEQRTRLVEGGVEANLNFQHHHPIVEYRIIPSEHFPCIGNGLQTETGREIETSMGKKGAD